MMPTTCCSVISRVIFFIGTRTRLKAIALGQLLSRLKRSEDFRQSTIRCVMTPGGDEDRRRRRRRATTSDGEDGDDDDDGDAAAKSADNFTLSTMAGPMTESLASGQT